MSRRERDDEAHWALYNLPPNLAGLPRGMTGLPPGAFSRSGPGGKAGYSGPCPVGPEASYTFWLYALDTLIEEPPTGQRVEMPLRDHVIGIDSQMASASFRRNLRMSISDLPLELRDKKLSYRTCMPHRGDCGVRPAALKDGYYVGALSFRSDSVELWFSDGAAPGVQPKARFTFDTTHEFCRRQGIQSECSISYSDLRSSR